MWYDYCMLRNYLKFTDLTFCQRNISNICVFNLVHAQAHYFLIRTHSIFPYILLWLIIERGTAVFEILAWYGFLCASKLLGLWFLLVYLKVLVDLHGLMIYPFNLHTIYSRSQINIYENAVCLECTHVYTWVYHPLHNIDFGLSCTRNYKM